MAEGKRDYYEVLGVPRSANEASIKQAYRNLAKKYHPDANPGDKEAEAKFKEASEAYAVLIDGEKRARYDQFGHAAFDGAAGGPGFDFNSAAFTDIFGDLFGSLFGGGFGGFGSRSSGGGAAQAGVAQGAHLRARLTITLLEAIQGTKKTLDLTLKEPCGTCGGSGAKPGTSPVGCKECGGSGRITVAQRTLFGITQAVRVCPGCNGSGKTIKEKCPGCSGKGYQSRRQKVQVVIPAGIEDGKSVRIKGKGEPGTGGGPWGDLLVEVRIAEDPRFVRQENHILSEMTISMTQAALGDLIRIPTVDGDVEYELSAGTQPGTRIRLRGKGVPYLRQPGLRGDQLVTFRVKVPESLNQKQRDALEAFDQALGGTMNRVSEKKSSTKKSAEKKSGESKSGEKKRGRKRKEET